MFSEHLARMMSGDEEGINLDGQWPDDLAYLAGLIAGDVEESARQLFPSQPAAYVEATRLLGEYAKHKGDAMTHRAAGRIADATKHENDCEKIYQQLPDFARW